MDKDRWGDIYWAEPSGSSWLKFLLMTLLILLAAAAAAKSLQSCLTLCDPIDGSQPGSPVPGILQARTLEWVAISFSNAWKWKVKVKFLSRVWLFATPWTAAYQAPPSMGFSRQEYWSGVPLPSLILLAIFFILPVLKLFFFLALQNVWLSLWWNDEVQFHMRTMIVIALDMGRSYKKEYFPGQ